MVGLVMAGVVTGVRMLGSLVPAARDLSPLARLLVLAPVSVVAYVGALFLARVLDAQDLQVLNSLWSTVAHRTGRLVHSDPESH